jgi:hypothetical protein
MKTLGANLVAAAIATFAGPATAQWSMPTQTTPAAAATAAMPTAPQVAPPVAQPAPPPPAPTASTRHYASYYPPTHQPGYGYGYPYQRPVQPQPAEQPKPQRKEKRVAFDATLGTIFPLGIGPALSLEIPGRVLFQADLMWMPAAYGKAISGLVQTIGGTETVIGPIIEQVLSNSLVIRAGAGWRPFKSAGFELGGGYTGIRVSGNVTPQVIGDLVGGDASRQIQQQLTEDVAVKSMLHNFHVTVGWRWVAVEHLVIRAFLGYSQTLTSSTSVSIPNHTDLEAQVNPLVDEEINKVVKHDLKLPLVGFNLGYRF